MCVWVCVWSGDQCRQQSVSFVGREQGSIYRLHTGGTREGPHQPVIYAVQVVDVHAGEEPDGVSIHKVHHADHTPAQRENVLTHTAISLATKGTAFP